jgi:hypothetical protein
MSRRERTMLIALAVVAVAAGGFFLFTSLGGEDAGQQAAPTQVPSPPPIVPAPGTGVGEPTEEPPPRMVNFFGGRDPFVPLVVEATDTTATTGTTDDTGGTTGETPTTPPEEGGGTIPPSDEPVEPVPAGAEAEEQPGTTVGGRQVTLVDIIDDDTVQVTVDGEAYRVNEGDEFAGNFRLVSVSGNCARFLFGDESFTLCQGEAPK